MSTMDVTPYLANLIRLAADEREAEQERARAVRDRLPAVVRLLVERFAVRRVVLFGSLVTGRLHERSDLDLAVQGLAPERYWEALWRCAEAAGRDVDLVLLEEASPDLLEAVEAEGEVLHG
jgi:predicted nucleotidyltransferase